ncbi:hypothetical protein [Paenibacillus sp. CF384]|uniref:hypothetical protein n=1 Tax=Paenibacillus sp. CF384 TaxID=1884382 RepID=UPI0008977E21|nr:hypothetical protein [Paenibacillus sp. CF384]SDX56012.1 hypothetical protein SAMN05518855_101686 [Paenibacillus sp. CF384]
MNQIKPIFPCPSIKEQTAFYEHLGFETVYTSNRPHTYAVVKYGELEIHFYGSKKLVPAANSQMCYVQVDDVNRLYEAFTSGLKQATGRIPRSGIPRISKLKDLAEDRRFIITDLGGNTLYVGTPNTELANPAFFRTIESAEWSGPFETLFDLMYSKEDTPSAYRMLEKFFPADLHTLNVENKDLAKILLVGLDIHLQLHNDVHPAVNVRLKALIDACDPNDADWLRISQQFADITNGE